MAQQLRATKLCNDINIHFKLLSIRTPFFHKSGMFLKALIEIIDWVSFEEHFIQNTLSITIKKLIYVILRVLGYA